MGEKENRDRDCRHDRRRRRRSRRDRESSSSLVVRDVGKKREWKIVVTTKAKVSPKNGNRRVIRLYPHPKPWEVGRRIVVTTNTFVRSVLHRRCCDWAIATDQRMMIRGGGGREERGNKRGRRVKISWFARQEWKRDLVRWAVNNHCHSSHNYYHRCQSHQQQHHNLLY